MTIEEIRARIENACIHAGRDPLTVKLVAVTKGRTEDEVRQLYQSGVRDFAENRPQKLLERFEQLPADVSWHLIGQLQKNKVAKIIGKTALIHSVDSLDLLQKIAHEADRQKCTVSLLLQVNLLGDAAKQGFTEDEALKAFEISFECPFIDLQGLMTMAPPLEEGEGVVRHTFKKAKILFDKLQQVKPLAYLSMGMSGDFEIAIEEGATLVRIGTALFE